MAATLKKQKKNTRDEFEERAKAIIVEFAQQGLNAALFYENKDPRTFVSLVPTSAHTGDGMGSLICLLVELTQTMLSKRLAQCEELRAQVMEVMPAIQFNPPRPLPPPKQGFRVGPWIALNLISAGHCSLCFTPFATMCPRLRLSREWARLLM